MFATPVLVGTIAWAGFSLSNRCGDSCNASAGNFNSEAAGVKAALQQLSQQIKRCPKSSLYISRFGVLAQGTLIDDVKIQFEPATKILAVQPDNSAQIQLWRGVNQRAILEVALYPQNLNGLKNFGAYRTR